MEKIAKQGHVWQNTETGEVFGNTICIPDEIEESFLEVEETSPSNLPEGEAVSPSFGGVGEA